MRRIFSTLALLAVALALPVALVAAPIETLSAFADPTSPASGFSFTVSGGDLTITGCNPSCSGTALTIPSSIGGFPVTAIGPDAFAVNLLTSVTIPDSVTSIGDFAFDANDLTSVTIPDSVTSIGQSSFVFNQIATVIFEGNLPSFGGGAIFTGNSPLPDIYYYSSSSGWSSLTAPDAFIDFGSYSVLASVPASPLDGFDFTFASGDLTITGCNPSCSGTALTIPSSIGGFPVTAIDGTAFEGDGLTSVTIPNSVTSIGPDAFALNLLSSVTIPDSVTSIGSFAFNADGLTSVTIPDSVTSIGFSSFASNHIATVIFEGNLPSFGGGAIFAGNTPLPPAIYYFSSSGGWSSLTTSNAISDFGPYSALAPVPASPLDGFDFTFANGALTLTGCDLACSFAALTIPSSIGGFPVTAIDGTAFEDDSLTSVTIPDSVTSIGSYAFNANELTSVTIPDSVTSIGDSAFYGNDLTSVTIPNSVTSIGTFAFAANNLTSVTIPDSLTSIASSAFRGNGISSVTIPASVSAVDVDAFAYNGLTSVTFLGAPPSGLANGFLNNPGGPAYYYSNQSGWSALSVNQGSFTLTAIPPVAVDSLDLQLSNGIVHATGSGDAWSVTVPQDSATTIASANFVLEAVNTELEGVDTAEDYPVTFVSGPGVTSGTPYGTLVYQGPNEQWTLTPSTTQTFETPGTWVLQATLSDLGDETTTVQLTLIVNPVPSFATEVATGITTTGATLSGTLTNNGTDAVGDEQFCYADVPFTTGDCTGTDVPVSGTNPFSADLTGLSSGTQYYAEFEASDTTSNTPLFGGVTTFTTLPTSSPGAVAFSPQAPLSLTSVSATKGQALTLTSSGGSGTGAVTYAVTSAGTANCAVNGDLLTTTNAGTCEVTVTKAGDATFAATSSSPTTIDVTNAAPAAVVLRVVGHAKAGSTVTVQIIGGTFAGRPLITSNEKGTRVLVTHDHGTSLSVRVTVAAGSKKGTHAFSVPLASGVRVSASYEVD